MKTLSHRPKRLKHALPTRPRSAPAPAVAVTPADWDDDNGLVRSAKRLPHFEPDAVEARVNFWLRKGGR